MSENKKLYYEAITECVVCGPLVSNGWSGDDVAWECDKPAIYRLWESDGDEEQDWGGEYYVCEEHWLEAYKKHYGTLPPGYIDKDARIAALEAENAALRQELERIKNDKSDTLN